MVPVTWRSRSAATVVALLPALVLLAGPATSSADNRTGTATYRYAVIGFKYSLAANITAARTTPSGCTAGDDAAWTGRVTEKPARLSRTRGSGRMHIGHHGTNGRINAFVRTASHLTDAEHSLTVECNGDGMHPGQGTDFAITPCADAAVTGLRGFTEINGGVGPLVRVQWFFSHPDRGPYVRWVLDHFRCVERFLWPTSQMDCPPRVYHLSKFTSEFIKLPFRCPMFTMQRPIGSTADSFLAQATVKGFVRLKRTRHF